jgi:hypothetical protein
VWDALGLDVHYEESLIADGGHLMLGKEELYVSAAVFDMNRHLPYAVILETLGEAFGVNRVQVLPPQPQDFTQHLDGMLRVPTAMGQALLYNYMDEAAPQAWHSPWAQLHQASGYAHTLAWPYLAKEPGISARGCYLNYLQLGRRLWLPRYDLATDWESQTQLQDMLPPGYEVELLDADCTALAREGGVLHCATWTLCQPANGLPPAFVQSLRSHMVTAIEQQYLIDTALQLPAAFYEESLLPQPDGTLPILQSGFPSALLQDFDYKPMYTTLGEATIANPQLLHTLDVVTLLLLLTPIARSVYWLDLWGDTQMHRLISTGWIANWTQAFQTHYTA